MAKFQKGISGNVAGRKPGNAKVAKLRELIADDIPDIIAKLTEMALGGDVQAAKVLIERTIPALRPQAEQVVIETIPNDNTAEIGRLVIDATLRGELAPDVSSQLLAGLASQVRIEEYTLLEQRIAQLEAGGGNG